MPVEKYKINMTDEGVEKDLSREDMVNLLREDRVTVTFTKADGTERVMECTLLAEVLNDRFKTDSNDPTHELIGEPPKSAPDTIPVWDIAKDSWRSFRMDSVKSIRFPTESQ